MAPRYDLEDRLIAFAVIILDTAEQLPVTRAGNHIASQLVRSGTSPAANYSEAQGSESKSDFIHKVTIAFKELRETRVWLRIILRKSFLRNKSLTDSVLSECEQLIRILGKTLSTAQARRPATSLSLEP